MGKRPRPFSDTPGVLDLSQLNEHIVAQDDELRAYCEAALAQGDLTSYHKAMLMAQCVIHERLGNLLLHIHQTGR